jgi:hypothetical protein
MKQLQIITTKRKRRLISINPLGNPRVCFELSHENVLRHLGSLIRVRTLNKPYQIKLCGVAQNKKKRKGAQ